MGISSDKKLPKEQKEKTINEKIESNTNSHNINLIKEKEIEKPKIIEVVNLIKTVKSKFIIENIFSCLEEKTKLIIIVHNKKYQNLFGLNIDIYKNKSGKYRIIEKNGTCKEYTLNENKLIFEGEFKNGEKNGNGKEFDNYGEVLFEGTYLNGKRSGKGKEYDCYKVKFDGEFLNGKRHGKGKEYNFDHLKFEGEFSNGKRSGNGKEYYYDGDLEFEGEYLNGERNGKGREYDENGKLVFEGEYNNGKKWKGKGKGEDFKGEYLNGKRWNGKGKEYQSVHVGPGCMDNRTILSFEGKYINGKRKGKGEIYDYESGDYKLKKIDE